MKMRIPMVRSNISCVFSFRVDKAKQVRLKGVHCIVLSILSESNLKL